MGLKIYFILRVVRDNVHDDAGDDHSAKEHPLVGTGPSLYQSHCCVGQAQRRSHV